MNMMKNIDTMLRSPMSIIEQMELKQTVHFYFCLLIAVKIDRRYAPQKSDIDRRLFIQRWLANAQRRKLFSKHLIDDIRWLKGEINKGQNYVEIEFIIFNAYNLYRYSLDKAILYC